MRLPPPFRAAARGLLGLFVLGQAAFLLAANAGTLLTLPPEAAGRLAPFLREPAEGLRAGEWGKVVRSANAHTQRWADLTGQAQAWSLFAPDVTDYVPFVALELRWDAGEPPRRLPSLNAPADPRHFFRVGNFRLRRYESTADVSPTAGQPFDPSGADWRMTLAWAVWNRQGYILTYLAWRLEAFRRAHPELPPPSQVILSVHLYRIPAPPGPDPWDWDDLGLHPVARWRPGAPSLEAYDPRTDDFGPAGGGGR
jgi:hypothetical protein